MVAEAIRNKEPLLFQNGKFDIAVMERWWGLSPDPLLCEDTLYQIFLYDPYADSFSLKSSAERILGIKPEEQNTLHSWIVANFRVKEKEAGAYIAQAPVELVSPYARGDVDRTLALYEFLKDKVNAGPYNREKLLRPILVEAERKGVRVNVEALAADLRVYEAALLRCEDDVKRQLGAPDCNLESKEELADALEKAQAVTEWRLTPTGRRSTTRDNILAVVRDPLLGNLLAYRSALSHCLSSFFRPWFALSASTGRMHPEWHSVRQARDDKNTQGTRTGRLSCSRPNFQNPPNEYDVVPPTGLPALPIMRKYILPEEGGRWYKRDYSQQELRILAHYAEGRLYGEYQKNPKIDAHETCQKLILDISGRDVPRKHVKITGFSIIYGAGVSGLATQLKVSSAEAASIRHAYFQALPDVGKLMAMVLERGRKGEKIRTWGGREYGSERTKDGRQFDYKLLNYLIQGSAADCTKEAIIRWHANRGSGVFHATVHDEVNITGHDPKDMDLLRQAMESIEFDVRMLTDGYMGDSWQNLLKHT